MAVLNQLSSAKAAVYSLKTMPFQKQWVEHLQQIQLKLEIAGTSRIEGAEFNDEELDIALSESTEEALSRSQRQARAAKATYLWIAELEDDRPINLDLVKEIHRRIVTGADDDHCQPGVFRQTGQNVTFGIPRHRGASGGKECEKVMEQLIGAAQTMFREHDVLVQALALHYHFASIHPFEDGNGRTARALEALCLQRTGLRDSVFIAMSNYYHDEKDTYLETLSRTRAANHNITEFLLFGLKGIQVQCEKLLSEISKNAKIAIYKDTMYSLFKRMESPRKRVIARRQLSLLNLLLETGESEVRSLSKELQRDYENLSSPWKAYVRDLQQLIHLDAVKIRKQEDDKLLVTANLEWPESISESDFMDRVKELPTAKSHSFLQ